jgi:hypothetical protein
MKFKDFKPEELIGKRVLYQYGQSYAKSLNKGIRTITKVTKTGFRISEFDDYLFGFDGYRKGLTGRENISTISFCELISPEQEKELIEQWTIAKEVKSIRTQITEKLDGLTIEQLRLIKEIIK